MPVANVPGTRRRRCGYESSVNSAGTTDRPPGCLIRGIAQQSSPFSPYIGSAWKSLGGGPTDARLTSVHAVTQGSSVRFSWRVADGKGIAGFAVYAQTQRLNWAIIAVHPARTYQYVGHWTGGGPYSLHVLLTTGRQLTVPMH